MAVKSDQRKDDLLQEVKAAFENEKTKVEKRVSELQTERESISDFKKQL